MYYNSSLALRFPLSQGGHKVLLVSICSYAVSVFVSSVVFKGLGKGGSHAKNIIRASIGYGFTEPYRQDLFPRCTLHIFLYLIQYFTLLSFVRVVRIAS